MKVLTIPQKMSNSGSIHDLESDLYDRKIRFRAGTKYAVVLAAYYGGHGYTTHKTPEATIRQSQKLANWSHRIIDDQGNMLEHNGLDGLRCYEPRRYDPARELNKEVKG